MTVRLAIVVILFGLCSAVTLLPAQEDHAGITISVGRDVNAPETEAPAYLNGYASSLEGQTIVYHSSHPDAESALLVRARRDVQRISWKTDPVPLSLSGNFCRFVWVAGIERAGWGSANPPHRFSFRINGEQWFTFRNRKDSTAGKWTENGKDGAELKFESLLSDKFGDLFGIMFLSVPIKSFPAGTPLVCTVEGEDAGSQDWFMTFQYSFNFIPKLKAEPALLRDTSRSMQQIRISLDNLEAGRTVAIDYPGHPTVRQALAVGANIVRIPVPAVEKERTVGVVYLRDGKVVEQYLVTLKPVVPREIYLVPHTHNDIGYTDLQPEVERKQWRYLDEALRLIHETNGYPPEAQFKWNMEILWPFESYLAKASKEKNREVLDAIRSGRLGLNALYVNPLTGLATAPEMGHFTDYARSFTAANSITITTAAISDIPGFTWGLVQSLAQSGVKYLASAPNSGDRIGYVLDQWGDKPFYWSSQSGTENILLWVAGSSYAAFHEGTLTNLGPDKIMKLVRKLDDRQYPYSIYYLPYTLGDNAGPDTTLSRFVRAWNERYISPRLVISTHKKLFEDFESKYGSSLPTYQGDFTPYWEDGAASTAAETALNRQVSDRLVQSEILWSVRDPKKYPAKLFYDAWRNVILWDEHTWGAAGSVTDPDSPMTTGQWKIKRSFVQKADSLSARLFPVVPKKKSASAKPESVFEIWNTTNWKRTDCIYFSREQSKAGDVAVDDNGKQFPSQRLSTGELAVLVRDVPPFSARRVRITRGVPKTLRGVLASGNRMRNESIYVEINRKTGTLATMKIRRRRELITDNPSLVGANRYYYVAGRNPDSAGSLTNVRVLVQEKGPLVAALRVEADAPGCRRYSSVVRLISGRDHFDIIDEIDKMPVREKEGIHIAFPMSVPGGIIHYDVAGSIVEPGKNQLPGSCKNFFSVGSWVDVSNSSRGVTWVTMDAPMAEFGAITAESPWMKTVAPGTGVFSYVMNNYWHTNYKADQEGYVKFRYSVRPHAGYIPEAAVRFAREQRRPLLILPGGSAAPAAPLLRITPDDLVVESMKPLRGDESFLLTVYNPSVQSKELSVQWRRPQRINLYSSDLSGSVIGKITGTLTIPGYGTACVRVDKKMK